MAISLVQINLKQVQEGMLEKAPTCHRKIRACLHAFGELYPRSVLWSLLIHGRSRLKGGSINFKTHRTHRLWIVSWGRSEGGTEKDIGSGQPSNPSQLHRFVMALMLWSAIWGPETGWPAGFRPSFVSVWNIPLSFPLQYVHSSPGSYLRPSSK